MMAGAVEALLKSGGGAVSSALVHNLETGSEWKTPDNSNAHHGATKLNRRHADLGPVAAGTWASIPV